MRNVPLILENCLIFSLVTFLQIFLIPLRWLLDLKLAEVLPFLGVHFVCVSLFLEKCSGFINKHLTDEISHRYSHYFLTIIKRQIFMACCIFRTFWGNIFGIFWACLFNLEKLNISRKILQNLLVITLCHFDTH